MLRDTLHCWCLTACIGNQVISTSYDKSDEASGYHAVVKIQACEPDETVNEPYACLLQSCMRLKPIEMLPASLIRLDHLGDAAFKNISKAQSMAPVPAESYAIQSLTLYPAAILALLLGGMQSRLVRTCIFITRGGIPCPARPTCGIAMHGLLAGEPLLVCRSVKPLQALHLELGCRQLLPEPLGLLLCCEGAALGCQVRACQRSVGTDQLSPLALHLPQALLLLHAALLQVLPLGHQAPH